MDTNTTTAINNKEKYVLLVCTGIGGILIELLNEEAPQTCNRFIQLCKTKRYNDTLIHRIIKRFFIQCGRYYLDPTDQSNNIISARDIPSNLELHNSETIKTTLKPQSTVFDILNNTQQQQLLSTPPLIPIKHQQIQEDIVDTNSNKTLVKKTTTVTTSAVDPMVLGDLANAGTITTTTTTTTGNHIDDDVANSNNNGVVDSDVDEELDLTMDNSSRGNSFDVIDEQEEFIKDIKKETQLLHQSQQKYYGGNGNDHQHDLNQQLLEETRNSGLVFDKIGVVCLGSYDQIIITLDSCDALTEKYPIFGRVHKSTMPILRKMDTIKVDANNSPLDPIFITSIEFLTSIDHFILPPTTTAITKTVIEPSTPRKRNSSIIGTGVGGAPIIMGSPIPDTPKLKRLRTQQQVTMPRVPSTLVLDQQQALMTCRLNLGTELNRTLSVPLIKGPGVKPKWPQRLVIVRHGQSEQNAALDLYQHDIDTLANVRDCDIKLTEIGEWQAKQTGKYLDTTEPFDICFVSPYQRAIDTANHIIDQLSHKPKLFKNNWLREKEFGRLHGLDEKSVRERYPEEYKIRNRDGKYWYRFPNGENYPDVEMRIHCFLEKISRDFSGRSILVVTHQVPYKLFRGLIYHLDEEKLLALEPVHNCGIQEYLLDTTKAIDGRLKLKHFNYKSYDLNNAPQNLKGNRHGHHDS
eukprot:gene6594-8162_t